MRHYIRLDPEVWDHKLAYPDGAFAAFVGLLCCGEAQPARGRFKTLQILKAYMGKRARWIPFLLEHGDLVALHGGGYYVEGWDEWQEGDWKVKERVDRIRAAKAARNVTVPTVNTSRETSGKPSERLAVSGKKVKPLAGKTGITFPQRGTLRGDGLTPLAASLPRVVSHG